MFTRESAQPARLKRTLSHLRTHSEFERNLKRHQTATSLKPVEKLANEALPNFSHDKTQPELPDPSEELQPVKFGNQQWTAMSTERGQIKLLAHQMEDTYSCTFSQIQLGSLQSTSAQPGKATVLSSRPMGDRSSPTSSDAEPSMPCTPHDYGPASSPRGEATKIHYPEVIILDDEDDDEKDGPPRWTLSNYVQETKMEKFKGNNGVAQSESTGDSEQDQDVRMDGSENGGGQGRESSCGSKESSSEPIATRIYEEDFAIPAIPQPSEQASFLLTGQDRLKSLRSWRSMRPKTAEVTYKDLAEDDVEALMAEEASNEVIRAVRLMPGETVLPSIERSVSRDLIPDSDDEGEEINITLKVAVDDTSSDSGSCVVVDTGSEAARQADEIENEEYEVERVVGGGRHVGTGEQLYEIQWVGYDLTTLEPASHCQNCADKIAEWAAVPRVADIMLRQFDEEQIVAMKAASNVERALRRSRRLSNLRSRRSGRSISQRVSGEQRVETHETTQDSGPDSEEHETSRPGRIKFNTSAGISAPDIDPYGLDPSQVDAMIPFVARYSTLELERGIKPATLPTINQHEKNRGRPSSAGSSSLSSDRSSLFIEQNLLMSSNPKSPEPIASHLLARRQASSSSDTARSTSATRKARTASLRIIDPINLQGPQDGPSMMPVGWKDTIEDTWTSAVIPRRWSKRKVTRSQSKPDFALNVIKFPGRSACSVEGTSSASFMSSSTSSPSHSTSPIVSLSPTPASLIPDYGIVKREPSTVSSGYNPLPNRIKRQYSISTEPEDLEAAMKARQANILKKCSKMLEELEALDYQGPSLSKERSKADLIRLQNLHEKWSKCMVEDKDQEDLHSPTREGTGKSLQPCPSQKERIENSQSDLISIQSKGSLMQQLGTEVKPTDRHEARDETSNLLLTDRGVKSLSGKAPSKTSIAQDSACVIGRDSSSHGPYRPHPQFQKRVMQLLDNAKGAKTASTPCMTLEPQSSEVPYVSVEEPLIPLTPAAERLAEVQGKEKYEKARTKIHSKRPGHPDRLTLIDYNTGHMRMLRTSAALTGNWDD
ncbi:hypothetical protein BP5796_11364 [Coleophoma crateriformis]|uniref:Chromo domain-containing protein n=1 Tax=Coleophoma crateriformis TaxID=565419 RepID=A0A3D8QI05_9HELO|nr:hypothetical protein BP5796_11364 [Coleophoma crateriformis]